LGEILEAGRLAPTAKNLQEQHIYVVESEEILMLLDLGYAEEGAGPLDNHSSRKELSETVSYI
nr:nitroreductase family protein [Butyrivibrio sp.]